MFECTVRTELLLYYWICLTSQVIQVKKEGGKWSAQTSWRVYCAHNYEVLKCFFSPDDSKVASCCHKEHKV